MGSRGDRAGHAAFLLVVGAAGWAAVTCQPAHGALWPGWAAAGLFFGVALGSRLLASPLAGARVSLDSAFFTAAAFCLGPRAAGLGVAATLTADALFRRLRAPEGPRREGRSPIVDLAYVIYFGGMSGGLLVAVARLWGVDAEPGRADVAWRVPCVGGTFVLTHYVIQAVQHRLRGRPWRESMARLVIGGVAEATLAPLAIAIALIWDPARPLAAALLGGTYLLVNFGWSRLALAKQALGRRVRELETLNRSARALGRGLDEAEQARTVCLEAARALPAADRIELDLIGADGRLDRHAWLKRRNQVEHRRLGRAEAETVRASELHLQREVRDAARPSVRAELAVPMTRYGEPLGVLRVEAWRAGTLGPDELRIAEAIAAQASAAIDNARLYALATVDGLTGLYVRRYFDARLEEEIERSRRFGASFSLILLDLDDFKRLNDTHGHLAGDRALREVARGTAAQLRGVDIAGRYGGEEIAVILPRTPLAAAAQVAERIRQAVSGIPLQMGSLQLRVTASIGVTGWVEGDSAQAVLQRADRALYRAKGAGKDRVEIDAPGPAAASEGPAAKHDRASA